MLKSKIEIKTGKLIHKGVITKLLRAVPKKYLKNIKKIKVTTIPNKEVRKETRFWGGIWASSDQEEKIRKEKTIFIYLYSIAMSTNSDLRYNNNWYHSAIEKIARSLYYEAYMISVPKKNDKDRASPALKFEERLTKKAKKLNLLDVPKKFKRIRFLKIMRDKHIDFVMGCLKKDKKFDYGFLPVIEHLRKVRLGLEYKYNISELYRIIFLGAFTKIAEKIQNQYKFLHLNASARSLFMISEQDRLRRNSMACFKRRIMKIAKGRCYVSKTGRRYVYFTDKDLRKIRKQLKWRPTLPKLYRQRIPKEVVIKNGN